jgi:hypothetical protein
MSLSILNQQRHDLGARPERTWSLGNILVVVAPAPILVASNRVTRPLGQGPGQTLVVPPAEEKQYTPAGPRNWLRPVAHLPVSIKERMGFHLIGWDD